MSALPPESGSPEGTLLIEDIGAYHGITLRLAAWDGVAAAVDLSCACMFESERGLPAPQGGLAHLDEAMGGLLVQIRKEHVFNGAAGELLFIDRPPHGIRASTMAIIGMGLPDRWSPEITAAAVQKSFDVAMVRGCASVAFAPSVLDSGLDPAGSVDMPEHMVRSLVSSLDASRRLEDLGLLKPLSLHTWVFDVGKPRFEKAVERFRLAFQAISSSMS